MLREGRLGERASAKERGREQVSGLVRVNWVSAEGERERASEGEHEERVKEKYKVSNHQHQEKYENAHWFGVVLYELCIAIS